jgi:hypothetical protein
VHPHSSHLIPSVLKADWVPEMVQCLRSLSVFRKILTWNSDLPSTSGGSWTISFQFVILRSIQPVTCRTFTSTLSHSARGPICSGRRQCKQRTVSARLERSTGNKATVMATEYHNGSIISSPYLRKTSLVQTTQHYFHRQKFNLESCSDQHHQH